MSHNPFNRLVFFFIIDTNDDVYMLNTNDVVKTKDEYPWAPTGIRFVMSAVGNGISNSPTVVLSDDVFEVSRFTQRTQNKLQVVFFSPLM